MDAFRADWFSTAALLGLALLPLALAVGRVWPRLRRAALLAPPLAFLAMASIAQLLPARAPEESQVSGRPREIQSEGYVTSRACQACHPQQYGTWRGSYHRTMTQLATPASVAPPPVPVGFEYVHNYAVMQRGDRLWVASDDPSWAAAGAMPYDAKTRPTIQRPVVLTTGSHHEQVFWFSTGQKSKLGLFPFVYRIHDEEWLPYWAVFLQPDQPPTEIVGRWNYVCSRCHTTNARPGIASPDDMDTQVSEWGIACEACHGPAGEHVSVNRNPARRYGLHLGDAPDPTIVNPAELSAQRASQVCGSCHSVHTVAELEELDAAWKRGFRYRPGEDLEATRHIVRPRQRPWPPATRRIVANQPHFMEDHFWPDGMVAVGGREYNAVTASPCYVGGEFSCLSCHKLHKDPEDARSLSEWADDQLAPGMDGDSACIGCHASVAEALESHTHHPAGSSGSECYNCHMPNTIYGLLKASRNHEVASPSAQETVEAGRPNACNLCHMDRTLAWTAEHLESWYGIPAPEFTDAEHERTADAVLMLLRGDAAQRSLLAWHAAWAPAQQASGSDWIAPVLAPLLMDPYAAVRNVAYRSLSSLPGYEEITYDPFASPEAQASARWKVVEVWERTRAREGRPDASQVLLNPDGTLQAARLERLLSQRDDRRVVRTE